MTEEKRYADVILDVSLEKLDRPFGYHIPDSLKDRIEIGSCVMVPFGKGNTLRKGYVVGLNEESSYDPGLTKDIASLAQKSTSAEERSLEMAAFLRRNYGGTMAQALKVVLPAKVTVRGLEKKVVHAKMSRQELYSLLAEAERKHQSAKVRLLQALLEQDAIPYEWITGKLGVSGQTISGLERSGALRIEVTKEFRSPVRVSEKEEKELTLSNGQREIADAIGEDLKNENAGKYLIYGITGSGKTEVYMELISRVVAMGQQAIVLIPEIALTYQTLMRFYQRFGDRVSVLNSTLSAGEKYDQCLRAKNGEIDIIIGPRSALFTPFPNLGLIVMDEEHENSYKSEITPKYHAREVAAHLAEITGAGLVLGSATPSLEAFEGARRGEIRLFRLTERLTGGALPVVYTVDLRQELREGNRSIFSRKLKELLADRLNKGEQAMLFLNRRGYAGFLSCRECGEVIKCPHCDVSLSEHYGGRLQCHYCGYEMPRPRLCPSCGSKYLAAFKAGTEQIEEKLRELFPGVRTLRMDRDTVRTKDSYEKILSAFRSQEADVLIGTQMIVKGHDFPKVTLVGVLAADLSLGSNDFRAAERTFQLLTQAVGRAGRGQIPGEAVIQTYQPDHYAVKFAAEQDYEGFFEEELLYRELGGYPPVSHLLAVQVLGRTDEGTAELAKRLADVLKSEEGLRVLGPAPGTIAKVRDQFRYAIYVKHDDRSRLADARERLDQLIREWEIRDTMVQFDFDPINIL